VPLGANILRIAVLYFVRYIANIGNTINKEIILEVKTSRDEDFLPLSTEEFSTQAAIPRAVLLNPSHTQ